MRWILFQRGDAFRVRGQPMQLYSMHRDGIDLANGSLALLGELLSFQLVSAALAAGGFLLQRQFLAEQLGRGQYLLLGGMGPGIWPRRPSFSCFFCGRAR